MNLKATNAVAEEARVYSEPTRSIGSMGWNTARLGGAAETCRIQGSHLDPQKCVTKWPKASKHGLKGILFTYLLGPGRVMQEPKVDPASAAATSCS